MARTFINSIDDFRIAIDHPYRIGEYFSDGTKIFDVPDSEEEVEALIDSYEGEKNVLWYSINWDDDSLYTDDGEKIPSVY